jgi:hypothetical protein
MRRIRSPFGLLTAFVLFGSAACGGGPGTTGAPSGPDEATGTVTAALTMVPSTVQCVQITVSPGTTQYLSPGANGWPASVDLGALHPGQVTVDGAAYDQPCKPPRGSQPSWVADEVTTQVFSGSATHIALVFHENAHSSGTIAFAPPVQALALTNYQTYALMADGTVRYWGLDLFDGTTHITATVLAGVTGATAIVARDNFGCALLADTTVRCWGSSGNFSVLANGQVGGASAPPTPIAGLKGVTQIAAGSTHICALLADQNISCWGENTFGQLFDGTTKDSNSAPVKGTLNGILSIVQVATSDFATFALGQDGEVLAAGSLHGEYPYQSITGQVSGVYGAQQIAAGYGHACATIVDGTVTCWGANGQGQLGDGTFATPSLWTAVHVAGLSDAVQVAAYNVSTCAVTRSGQVKCWGLNDVGELGDGQVDPGNEAQITPNLPVVGISTARSIPSSGSSDFSACALLADSTVRCWGDNTYYNLGDGTDVDRFAPVTPQF